MTQQLAAERSDMSVEGYARLERGQRSPTAETLLKVCRGLDVAPNQLLDWGSANENPGAEEPDAIRARLKSHLDELDEDALRLVGEVLAFARMRRRG